jgi:hypothetical protein
MELLKAIKSSLNNETVAYDSRSHQMLFATVKYRKVKADENIGTRRCLHERNIGFYYPQLTTCTIKDEKICVRLLRCQATV